jgi:inner membrane protein
MDTITHALFGLTIYSSVDKRDMSKEMKRSVLFTTMVGSQIPDIDVVSKLWDTEGMYQMWHRGITHSLWFVPLWALVLISVCLLIWKVKDRKLFLIALLSVFIHSTSDLFNAWGTGYLEPFSPIRITFGTIPIVDFAIWAIILGGYILWLIFKWQQHLVFRIVGIVIVTHIAIQSVQGYWIYHSVSAKYEEHTLAASFVPWHFNIIGKNGNKVEISEATIWQEPRLLHTLTSAEDADLDTLFAQNPKAKTLHQWSPLVVIVDDEERLGIYDPRFYQDGQSFLFEYIEK